MNKSQNKICSVCSNEIDKKYCSKCGQYFTNKRITSGSVLNDLFNSIFSLEKSFLKNMKIGLTQPEKLILNYWKGYRGFYYSPGKFFTIGSLLLLLHYLFANDFLGIIVTSTVSSQFVILLFNIFLLTFLSYLVYFKQKKNFHEHLVQNIYNVSIWTIIFVPISIMLNAFVGDNFIEQAFFLPYHLLIIIWNSKVFEISKLKRFSFVSLNLILFYGIIFLLIFTFGEF